MSKRYFTIDKTGEEVEVDSATASQLVKLGKRNPSDFTIEDGDQSPATADTTKTEKPETIGQQARKGYGKVGGFIFPTSSAAKARGEAVSKGMSLPDYFDLLNAPTRAASAAFGHDPYDPESYAGRTSYQNAVAKAEAATPEQKAALAQEKQTPQQYRGPLSAEAREAQPPSELPYQLRGDPGVWAAPMKGLAKGAKAGLAGLTHWLSGGAKPYKAVMKRTKPGGKRALETAAISRAERIEEAAEKARHAKERYDAVKDVSGVERERARKILDDARGELEEARALKSERKSGVQSAEAELKTQISRSSEDFFNAARELKDPVKRKKLFPEAEQIDAIIPKLPKVDVQPAISNLQKSITEFRSASSGLQGAEAVAKKLEGYLNWMKGTPEKERFFRTKFPASELRKKRLEIDNVIKNWDDPGSRSILEKKLIPLRQDLEIAMREAAKKSGNPEYAEIMSNWHNKLSVMRDLERYLGAGLGAKGTKEKAAQLAKINKTIQSVVEHGPKSSAEVEMLAAVNDLFKINPLPGPQAQLLKTQQANDLLRMAENIEAQKLKGVSAARKKSGAITRQERERVLGAGKGAREASRDLGAVQEGPRSEMEQYAEALGIGPKLPKIGGYSMKPKMEKPGGGATLPTDVSGVKTGLLEPVAYGGAIAAGGVERVFTELAKYGIPAALASRLLNQEELKLPTPMQVMLINQRKEGNQ